MILPIEVYWPSDEKWHPGRVIDKFRSSLQYMVDYGDGGTRWEALVEQYDGDGVPPCRGDEDHSYWRVAEASTSEDSDSEDEMPVSQLLARQAG